MSLWTFSYGAYKISFSGMIPSLWKLFKGRMSLYRICWLFSAIKTKQYCLTFGSLKFIVVSTLANRYVLSLFGMTVELICSVRFLGALTQHLRKNGTFYWGYFLLGCPCRDIRISFLHTFCRNPANWRKANSANRNFCWYGTHS